MDGVDKAPIIYGIEYQVCGVFILFSKEFVFLLQANRFNLY